MIEIAFSLAVIGFALVAIVGILPIGMGVQKENRQETVVNQDASVFLDAIRNGAMGLDDLTNYVMAITNTFTRYSSTGIPATPQVYGYTPVFSSLNGGANSPQFPLINGYRIIGLLSTPKYIPVANGFYINNVVAYVRSLSGPASEKFPQNNASLQDLAFSYRLRPEIVNYGTYSDPSSGALQLPGLNGNLFDLRLTFRWPLVDPKGKTGPSQQSFRAQVAGSLQPTNEFVANYLNDLGHTLYFFQPRTFVKGQ
jgi:type II secretory pathway pseudopilin PulG